MLSANTVATPLSDEALVARARRRVPGAFDTLVRRYQDRIYRLAIRMSGCRCDAEEITQDAFLSAHKSLDSFQGNARFGTWLYRIAVNEALMRRRSAARRPADSLDDLLASRGDAVLDRASAHESRADDLLESKLLAQRVRDALASLDETARAALVLRDLEGLSSEEAADVLGVSPETVRQRAHRARLRLREMLSPAARAA